MHAGRCRTIEEVLGLCSLSGCLSQEPYSDTIGSRQDSVHGLAWIQTETTFEASLSVQMLGFCAHSGRETRERGILSKSRHIRWVQHIN